MRLRAAPALALAASCATLLGCGGVSAGDLFIVERSGSAPHAHLTLLVDEEGGVTCNGRKLRLSDSQLVKARAIQEELQSAASRHLSLPPRAGSVLRYYLRDENGSVSFADNSAAEPSVMHELQLFVLTTAQKVCHLPE